MTSYPINSSSIPAPLVRQDAASPEKLEQLRKAAIDLEASFLAEMLQQAGLGEMESEFSGGIGEEQFSSFLRQEQAKAMAQAGGIGLAEQIFNAMVKRIET
ncbi:hypothetical protein BFP70_12160 [Thioclava sp. SK-1]|uniref:rod-binding protein n=1 Tax=Thioclava sp. SK-1 TaxID=1889770 RepID=UPI00082534D7|nr:rod-binding protein [Thioclava sp. SK-1]OCX63451.1 hypothetical protein BFP70_12160 [Thioclava sp. SK-1]